MRIFLLAGVFLGAVAPAHAACKAISPGQTTSGQASSDTPYACFTLSAPIGKKVTVRVKSSAKDMAFNIAGIVDNQDRHTFTATKGSYQVDVYRTFRGGAEKFELSAR